jgi:hypothetical protein
MEGGITEGIWEGVETFSEAASAGIRMAYENPNSIRD